MTPVHPGRVLERELVTCGLSSNRLALALRVPSGRITSMLDCKRAISPDTALRLARCFGNGARFRMNLQTRYDLTVATRELGEHVEAEVGHAA